MLSSILMALVALGTAEGYFGPGWAEEHTGSQLWSVACTTNCSTQIARFVDTVDIVGRGENSFALHVSSAQKEDVAALLQNENLSYEVYVEDLAAHLKKQHEEDQSSRRLLSSKAAESCTATSCPDAFKSDYMTFQQMEWFLKELSTEYHTLVTLTSEGKTTEGRDLWLVRVAAHNKRLSCQCAKGTSKAVFVEGGMHAREWVSSATVLNILKVQVIDCANEQNCDAIFYFMPAINPDGYEYSRLSNRFWRKNRSQFSTSDCVGTDLNRNFDYKWGFSGSSSNECSYVYKGPSAFSEPETTAEKNVLQAIIAESNKDLNLYISYHSYSQLVLYPWGYSASATVPDEDLLIAGAQIYKDSAKAVNGMTYTPMNAADLYPAAGASDDYAKHLDITLAYTIELRDTGRYGFQLPTNQILPTYTENLAGFRALVNYAGAL